MKPNQPIKRESSDAKSESVRKRTAFNNSDEMKCEEPSVKRPNEDEPKLSAEAACDQGTVTSERYLRIGNLPEDTKPEELIHFLNVAMQQENLCYIFEESPIRNCLVSEDIAFIGMAGPVLAHQALSLTGIPYFGNKLEIGRPRGYSGTPGGSTRTWQELAAPNETSSQDGLI